METGIEVRELPPREHPTWPEIVVQSRARQSEIQRAYERGRGDRWVTLLCGIAIGAAGVATWWGIALLVR